ncbi:MAG TPA: hypothetical protein DCG12_09050 [Planctomycetaceae bacterium]|nr:hypothetical protein [Planctomycetaceae bacterium]
MQIDSVKDSGMSVKPLSWAAVLFLLFASAQLATYRCHNRTQKSRLCARSGPERHYGLTKQDP